MSAPPSPLLPSSGSPSLYPKSCLKRNSVASTTSFTDPDSGSPGTSPSNDSCLSSPTPPSESPSAPSAPRSQPPPPSPPRPPASPTRTRPKSVSFSEDHDVRLIYPEPPPPPLRKQARRAASRIFRACAEALRIDSSSGGSSDGNESRLGSPGSPG